MTSRERVHRLLHRLPTDRIPLDLGSTFVTGIAAGALARLQDSLGLDAEIVKVVDPFQVLGLVPSGVLESIGADFVGLPPLRTLYGYRNEGWKPWVLQDGTRVEVGSGFVVSVDASGNQYLHPQGDRNAPPSAVMPAGGYYFDNIVRQEPYNEEALDGRRDFREDYQLLTDEELECYRAAAAHLHDATEYSIVGNFGDAGIGNQGRLPAPWRKRTPGIRRSDEWYMAHLLHPAYVHDAYDCQIEMALKNLELYREAVGDSIEIIYLSGTDFGSQKGEMISPELFREFYKPRFTRVNAWVHAHTKWKTFYHSCGSIVRLLDDFVEMGADIINPVQCSAFGMDPEVLKRNYGSRFILWGGAVDCEGELQFGTPTKVRQKVTERLQVLASGGGYVFCQVHNIQQTTPVENIRAMYEALRAFEGARTSGRGN